MATLVLLLATCLAGPPLVVGLAAVGIPWQVTGAIVAGSAAVVLWRTALQARAIGWHRLHWLAVVAALVVLGAATIYTLRLSTFMLDETRADLSVLPDRAFFRNHSCLSSYTEAARLAPSGVNIFDIAQYADPARPDQQIPRVIGSFEVDLYQYPPGFLILPRAAVSSGLEFLTIRRLWFAIQCLLFLGSMVALASWIGGPSGLLALLLTPIVWLAPTTRLGFQMGNFQLTAFALSMLAMIAFDRSRVSRGGFLLAFPVVSKIFPGVLGVQLVVDRQWRAVAGTLVWSAAFTAAAWLTVGSTPFVDFVRYQLPRIESGQAFFWIDSPEMAPVNYGIHGLVIKLRSLGLPWTGQAAANAAARWYAIVLLLLAVLSAWRVRALVSSTAGALVPERLRLRRAQVWLALLSLGSFRSPFVPDAYALVGTLWLLTLVAAEAHWQTRGRLALVAAGAATMIVLDGGAVPAPVPASIIVATLCIQLAAIAFNAAIALTPGRTLRAPGEAGVAAAPIVPAAL